MARSSLQIVVDQRTPLTLADKSPKGGRQLLRMVIRRLEGILGGTVDASFMSIDVYGAQPIAAAGTATMLATVAANDTVSINGAATTATQLRAAGVVTCASVSANDTVTVGSITFTAVNGGSPTGIQFDMSGSDTATAGNLVAAINAHATTSALVTAKNAAGVVTVAVLAEGTAGNATVTFTSSNGSRLAITGTSGSKLANGAAASDDQFDFKGTAVMTATSLARSINATATALITGHVEASNWAGSVTLATCTAGTRLWIANHEFRAVAAAGNAPNVFPGDFSIASTDTNDAVALRDAINAHPVLSHQVVASSSSGVVTIRQRRGTSAIGKITVDGIPGVTPSGLTVTTQFVATSVVRISAKHEGQSGNAITLAESTSAARMSVSGARLTAGTGSVSGTKVRVAIGATVN